jgi:NADPH-dependent 2,4-dienoyl-CoA reductase/sulfur reductase-like enzyme/nitrite reductase/ring-hydroxylating ferredoxin subunit
MPKKIPANRWVEIAPLTEIEEGRSRLFVYGQDRVLVHRSGDAFTASLAECTHHGGALDEGMLVNHVLTCPWHSSRFNLRAGSCESPPALHDLFQFNIKTKDGMLLLKRKKHEDVSLHLRRESGTYLIIGNGAAGLAAAVTLRREGFDGRLIIITAEMYMPYDRPRLSKDYLSDESGRNSIFLPFEDYFRQTRIELLMGRQVAQVDPEERQIVFMDGDYLLYDKLLIATGGIPRTPVIPGTDLKNFFLLRSIRDADSIAASVKSAKSALIIGAGFIGLEIAAVLREQGLEVYLVAPEKVPLADVFGKRIGERIRNLHEERGVHFHLGRSVIALRGEDSVKWAELSDESTLEVDMVVAGIGIVPAVHFLEDAGIVDHGAIPVDEQMCTSAERIYAAGDIVQVQDLITGGRRRVEHWTEAMQQGRHAARCMMGSVEPYREIPFFWTKQYDTLIRFAGYIPKVKKVVYRGDVEKGEFTAAYYRGSGLCAVCCMGRDREFMMLHHMMRDGTTIGKKDMKRGEFQFEGAMYRYFQ